LTRDLGRIAALAKGARRPKGPFEGALDLLAVCRVVVLRKNTDALDLLTEAKLHRRFRGAERSMERLYAGYYVTEMLRLLLDDNQPHADVYDLTIRTLREIDGTGNVTWSLAWFDLQLLRMLGHVPGTDRCTDCGGDVPSTHRIPFSLEAGGVVCATCRPRQRSIVSIREAVIEQIRRLQRPDLQAPIEIPYDLSGELRALLNRYIQTVVGIVPRMQAYFPLLTRTDTTA
jgi:DNA repair protein RecO (recombination protein O)